MARMVITAVSMYAAFMSILFVITALGVDSLPVLMALLALGFASMGVVIPSTMVLALDDHGPIAGMASALGGTLQMLTGGLMIVIVSFFFNGTPMPMVATMTVCALGAFVLSVITLRGRRFAPQPAE